VGAGGWESLQEGVEAFREGLAADIWGEERGERTVVAEFRHKILDVRSRESAEGVKAECCVFRYAGLS
jgi:hypothetical protein